MSVTQNYTITMSSDAWLAVVAAVLTSVRDDRRELDRMPLMPGWAEWINSEIKLKSEALGALNLAKILTREDTHGALDGEMLSFVVNALHILRSITVGGFLVPGMSMDEATRKECIERTDAVLLFLENPK